MPEKIDISFDQNSPQAVEARELALRLIAAGQGGRETYSRELARLVNDIMNATNQTEMAKQMALLLDGLQVYARVGLILFADRSNRSFEDAMRVLEKGVARKLGEESAH